MTDATQTYDNYLVGFDKESTYKMNPDGTRTGKLFRDAELVRDFDYERTQLEEKRNRFAYHPQFMTLSSDDQDLFLTNPLLFVLLHNYTMQYVSGCGNSTVCSTNNEVDKNTNHTNHTNHTKHTDGDKIDKIKPKVKEDSNDDVVDDVGFDLFG